MTAFERAYVGFGAFTLYFFRDPERTLPIDPTKIYSPGDGVVMSVAREGPGDTVTLRIFLSVFNVHVQRAPCAGRVTKVIRSPGSSTFSRCGVLPGTRKNSPIGTSRSPFEPWM